MLVRARRMITVIALLTALTAVGNAQQPGGRGFGGRGMPGGMGAGGMGGMGGAGLLRSEQVQKELNLTDEQKAKLEKLRDKLQSEMRERFSGMEGLSREERQARFEKMREEMQAEAAKRAESLKKDLAEILQPEQLKRLRQIELQQERTAVLLRPEVAEFVGLTAEQKESLEKIRQETQEKMQAVWQDARGGDREALGGQMEQLREKTGAIRTDAETKAMAVLKPEQKQKLGEMLGKPFELDRSQFGRPQGGDREQRGGDRERRGGDRERRGGDRNET